MATILRDAATRRPLAARVRRATTWLGRLVGALGERRVAPDEGVWLEPCSAIHTFGMRATIDVIVLDRDRTIVALRPHVRPNRAIVTHRRAHTVLEMGAGFLTTAGIAVGDRLALED